jgi:hypothetical protein
VNCQIINYREINTPAKLSAFYEKLKVIPKSAVMTKIDGQTYFCENRGGHDLDNGMKITDLRCWQK